MAKATDNRKKTTQVRMDDALKARIRAYQRKLREIGIELGFGAAVRSLIEKGLETS